MARRAETDDLDDLAADEYELWAIEMYGRDFDLFRRMLHRRFPEHYREPAAAKPTLAIPGPRKVKCMAERRAAGFSCFAPGDLSSADEAIERLARVISTHPNSAVVVRNLVAETFDEQAAITEDELADEQEFEAFLNHRRGWIERHKTPRRDAAA